MTTANTNAQKLKTLMKECNNLTQAQVADVLCVSLDTVKAWFAKPSSKRYRPLNITMLNLLNAELIRRKIKTPKSFARHLFDGIMFTEAHVANTINLISAGEITEAQQNLDKVLETINTVTYLLISYGEEKFVKKLSD